MEDDDVYSLADERPPCNHPQRPITPITAFNALPDADDIASIRVIGVRQKVGDPDDFEFVVIIQALDGDTWVSTRDSLVSDTDAVQAA